MPAARSSCAMRLIVGQAILVEDEHHDRALHVVALIFAEKLEAEQEARHADRDAGGGHLLAGEALDQPVVAAAAHHRAEPHGLPALVLDGRRQLRLEHGAGVIFEPAHDGGIDHDAVGAEAGRRQQIVHGGHFADAFLADCGALNQALQAGKRLAAVAAGRLDER